MRRVIYLAVLLAGCVTMAPSTAPAFFVSPVAGPAFFVPPSVAGESHNLDEVEKWNSYVDLAHELEALFLPALNAYLETFGHSPEYQPAQGSGLIANYFLVLMERPEDLGRVLDQARGLAEQGEGELDQAVRELWPYLQVLWIDLKRSRDYHQNKEETVPDLPEETGELRVRLDSPEETHARIFAAYQGFAATYDRFRQNLNRAGQERRQKDIRELREKGLIIQPALLEILDVGQALQDYLNFRHISGAAPAGLKPEEIQPFLDRLKKSAGALEVARSPGIELEGFSAEALNEFYDQWQVVLAEADLLVAGPGDGGGRKVRLEDLARALGRLVDIYNIME